MEKFNYRMRSLTVSILHNLLTVMKPRIVRWTERVACMRHMGNPYQISVKKCLHSSQLANSNETTDREMDRACGMHETHGKPIPNFSQKMYGTPVINPAVDGTYYKN